jgi:hypothetical protein
MPTFATVRHKVVTNFGDTFISTREAANEGDVSEWIKANFASISGAFDAKSGGAAVKVTAVYRVSGDGSETLLWSA